jgi:hypothetical protein
MDTIMTNATKPASKSTIATKLRLMGTGASVPVELEDTLLDVF